MALQAKKIINDHIRYKILQASEPTNAVGQALFVKLDQTNPISRVDAFLAQLD